MIHFRRNDAAKGRLIVWATVLLCCLQGPALAVTEPARAVMKKIRFVGVETDRAATRVVIRGDGRIPAYTTRTMAAPPRIIVDIACRALPFKSITQPVSGSILETVKIGHHDRVIRLVMVLNGTALPGFSSLARGDELAITLHGNRQPAAETRSDEQAFHPSAGKGGAVPPEPETPRDVSKTALLPEVPGIVDPDTPESGPPDGSAAEAADLRPTAELLTQGNANDGQGDSVLFGEGIAAYRSGDWTLAAARFNELIRTYPDGRYTERAYFLRPRAFEQIHLGSISLHFKEIKRLYEDAAYRYPQSIHVPDAHVSIGSLCLRANNHSEALGYFNLVIEKENDLEAALRALMQKARILTLNHQKEKTLPIYEHVIRRYSGTAEAIIAKIEKAKILFEMNRFHQSLAILTALERQLENIYAYPDIFRYLGDNYYQLGRHDMARKNLFRYYNLCPEEKHSHLILARIADIYREEGAAAEATKFYKLVLKRYPKSEGALISMYRLAEQQEKGEIRVEKKVVPDLDVIDSEVQMPRRIYEDVIRSAIEKDDKSPLIQFALLKLSILNQKEQDYDQSLRILKELLERYPGTRLKKEINQTLAGTLVHLLQKDFRTKRFKRIINVFQAEKELIHDLKTAEIFIIVARASVKLALDDMALEMFKQAEPLLADEHKPADLLLAIGRDSFENKNYPKARMLLDTLLRQHADSPSAVDARLLKGKMLLADQKPSEALALFDIALAKDPKRCRRIEILISMSDALIEIGSVDRAAKTLTEAGRLSKACPDSDYRRYLEIAELFIRLNDFRKALAVASGARDMETDEKNRIRLELVMARCYESLNQKEQYLAIYDNIANRNDPFWSSLARERMEEIQFEGSFPKKEK